MDLSIGAVVVAFNPPPGLASRLDGVGDRIPRLLVIDNASDRKVELPESLELIRNQRNLGIATALNQGIERLAAAGCDWALLLDHDSTPSADMVEHLAKASQHPTAHNAAALVPRIQYAHPEIRCRWPCTAPGARFTFSFVYGSALREPHAVDLAISSGMLLNIEAWKKLGGFREDLFIDLVDTEFCLRARKAGYSIVAVPGAILQHALGHVEQRKVPGLPPMYPTHHAPVRHYYLGRNRVLLARAHATRFPSWLFYELMSAAKLLAKVLLFEENRWRKVRATVLGTWDGILGRTGACTRRLG